MNKGKYLQQYLFTILASAFIVGVCVLAINIKSINQEINELDNSIEILLELRKDLKEYLVSPRKIDLISTHEYFNVLNVDEVKPNLEGEFWNELKLFLINFNYSTPKSEVRTQVGVLESEIDRLTIQIQGKYDKLESRFTLVYILGVLGCIFAGLTAFLAVAFNLQREKLAQKTTELELTKAEAEKAVEAKSEFLNVMSHEIRTPLNAVIGLSHILAQSNPTAAQLKHIELLQFSSENLLILINDILDFGKIEAGKVDIEERSFDLSKHLRKIISSLEPFARSKNLMLRFDIHNEYDEKVIGDPTRLGQIIFNLVNNAIKFTQKGEVNISLTGQEESTTDLNYRISVKDTGIGIAEEKRDQIFEQFSQANSNTSRKYGGSGLGLTISQKLLRLMGSSLQLESEVGIGSEFWFDMKFPKATTNYVAKQSISLGDSEQLKSYKILVVEDNRINLLILEKLLADLGFKCDTAANGEEAVSKVLSTDYDMILMDLQMPVMDGFKASEKISEHKGDKKPVIIAISAANESSLKSRMKNSGIEDYMVKPIDVEQFKTKLSKFVNL